MGYSYDAGSYLEKMYETARYKLNGFSPTYSILRTDDVRSARNG